MAYFKIDGADLSMYVNSLKVNSEANYHAQTNAAGNTVVDFINRKRTIEVGIIPLDNEALATLLTALDSLDVYISFVNPVTGALEENVYCIAPSSNIEYYTIQVNKVMCKAFTIKFIEL